MGTSNRHSRMGQINRDQKMADGMRKHLAGIALLPIASQPLTPEQIAQTFEDRAAAGKAAQVAAAAHAAVLAYRAKFASMASFESAAKRVVTGMFQASPATLADFGLQAPRPSKKTAATKAEAALKNEAMRKARHTMGASGRRRRSRGTWPASW